jgi:hypothetical protein
MVNEEVYPAEPEEPIIPEAFPAENAEYRAALVPAITYEAVYTGPAEQIVIEGVGVVLAEQIIPDTDPSFEIVRRHPDFTVRPV